MASGDVDVAVTIPRSFNCNIFDGVDDYVDIPHNSAQLGANLANGFTISAWINPRTAGEGNIGTILDKSSGVAGTNGFAFYYNGLNLRAELKLNNGNARATATSSINYSSSAWKHVLVTCASDTTTTFYLNNVQSGTIGTSTKLISDIVTTNAPRIGNLSGGTTTSFGGAIKSVKMWNRVLTSEEIAQDYAGLKVDTPIHNFRLGGDYTDYGSVGVTATNSGSVPSIVEDRVAVALKTQRTAGGATGKYMMEMINGSLMSIAITG